MTQRKTAQEQEERWRIIIASKPDNIALGAYIFEWKTGKKNKGLVSAEQREGYFLIFFVYAEDLSHFSKGIVVDADVKKSQNIGGRYHRAIRLPIAQDIKAVLVNGPADLSSSSEIVRHERQHFFNDVAFGGFIYTESEANLSNRKAHQLRNIKDEVLAYLRDGSSAEMIANFLDNKELYGDLMYGFTTNEQKDVKKLMKQIEKGLSKIIYPFDGDGLRAKLVYQLVDVPLDRFPEMLDRMVKYYKRKNKIE